MDIVDVCVAIAVVAAAAVAAANDAAVIRVFVFASVCVQRTQNCHFLHLHLSNLILKRIPKIAYNH